MADIRTKEGREELRQEYGAMRDTKNQIIRAALDGLDIAEEMAEWASQNPKHCRFCGGWFVLKTHVLPEPGDLEVPHTEDCLGAKWDKWKGE